MQTPKKEASLKKWSGVVLWLTALVAAAALAIFIVAMANCAANFCSDRRVSNENTVGLLADGVAFYGVLYFVYL